jgi:hypothetical protein
MRPKRGAPPETPPKKEGAIFPEEPGASGGAAT